MTDCYGTDDEQDDDDGDVMCIGGTFGGRRPRTFGGGRPQRPEEQGNYVLEGDEKRPKIEVEPERLREDKEELSSPVVVVFDIDGVTASGVVTLTLRPENLKTACIFENLRSSHGTEQMRGKF